MGDKQCASCQRPLEPVWPDAPEHQCQQRCCVHRRTYSDALTVRLEGGYGEYFDDDPIEMMVCQDCADDLYTFLRTSWRQRWARPRNDWMNDGRKVKED